MVIDHSVQVDEYGTAQALADNNRIEFERNGERYAFLRWGQSAFRNFKVVPPNTGIVHQVNLEFLSRVIFPKEGSPRAGVSGHRGRHGLAHDDDQRPRHSRLGRRRHRGRGRHARPAGDDAHPAGDRLQAERRAAAGATATDLVLTVTQQLRKKGVVDKFVEFFGDGLANLPLADRATIGNMSPEFGSTCAIFPIDEETIRYLKLSGRPAEQVELVEAYAKAQGLWRLNGAPAADYTDVLELDLGTVEPSLAGPSRPQDRVPLRIAKQVYQGAFAKQAEERKAKNPGATGCAVVKLNEDSFELQDGAVLIAAITSCTNTSNPNVLVAAGLLARNAASHGAHQQALGEDQPGARFARGHGLPDLRGPAQRRSRSIGFNLVGYGCTTCIGNSGPLKPEISAGVQAGHIIGHLGALR